MTESGPNMANAIPFHPPLAKVFGNCEALILHQVHFYASARKKKRDGHYWMWHSLTQWEAALLLSRSTIQRSIRGLEELGVIISSEFNGSKFNRTKWYRLDYGRLLLILTEAFPQHKIQVWRDTELNNPWQWVQVSEKEVPTNAINCKKGGKKAENPDHLDIVNMTTSTWSEVPTLRRSNIEKEKKNNKRALATPEHGPETTSVTEEADMIYSEKPLPKNKRRTPKVPTTVKSVSAVLDDSQVSLADSTVTGLYKVWASEVPKHHSEIKFVAPFTMKQKGQMGRISKIWEKQQGEILVCLIRHWLRFGRFVQEQVGGKNSPASPNLDYLAKHVALAKSFYLNQQEDPTQGKHTPKLSLKSAPAPVQDPPTPATDAQQVGRITFRRRKKVDPTPTPTPQSEEALEGVTEASEIMEHAGLLTDKSDTMLGGETTTSPQDETEEVEPEVQVASLIKYRLGKKRFTK